MSRQIRAYALSLSAASARRLRLAGNSAPQRPAWQLALPEPPADPAGCSRRKVIYGERDGDGDGDGDGPLAEPGVPCAAFCAFSSAVCSSCW
jgi:hypothetical protein